MKKQKTSELLLEAMNQYLERIQQAEKLRCEKQLKKYGMVMVKHSDNIYPHQLLIEEHRKRHEQKAKKGKR